MEKETAKRGCFPTVTTTVAQKEFVNETLLPMMQEAGLIASPDFSELVRWAIVRGSIEIGKRDKLPLLEKLKRGRKPKENRIGF